MQLSFSRPTRRPAVVRTRAAAIDPLEGRRMMSATRSALLAKSPLSAVATIKPLKSVSSLSKSVRNAVNAAGAGLFTAVSDISKSINGQTQHVALKSATPFTLDLTNLSTTLLTAPLEYSSAAATAPLVLAVPMPDGTLARFKVVKTTVMDPALAAQYPSIQTYRGIGIDDPTADLRLDTTPLGFHAQVLSPNGAYYIDPYYLNDAGGGYVSFFKSDAILTDAWTCSVVSPDTGVAAKDEQTGLEAAQANSVFLTPSITYAGTLKTYRAAIAGDGEYVAAAGGGTVAGGLAAITTILNRVDGVYQTELDITMTLVAAETSIIYTNANTDPYTNNNPDSLLTQNQSNLTSVIGSANYDIGHVFTTGGGGLSGLGVVGKSTKKAQSETGLPTPVGDAFAIDFVAHEMGHEFGADHTFNTADDTSNRNAATAYEPGSGITIMAYAGVINNAADDTSDDNLDVHSIPYFHSSSIDEIRTYIGTISSTGTSTQTGNTAPTVSAGPSTYVIPTGTPFALTATGSDPNGDTVTYDWEERDLGVTKLLSDPDNGSSPLFRDFAPTTNPTRVFPQLASILAGLTTSGNYLNNQSAPAERLPTVAHTAMNFRVIARDNKAGGGGVSTADMSLKVVNTGSAFLITNFSSASTIAGGSTQTLTWNVAGTTANGINAATVNILLSTDGGLTFSKTLVANTANDGSEPFQVPYATGSTTARIKIVPTNNIFFDINNADLTITNVAVPNSATPGVPTLTAASDTGVSNSDNITRFNNADAGSVLSFNVTGTVSGALVELLADGAVIGSANATTTTTTITTNPLPAGSKTLADGTHLFSVRQTESGKPVSAASATRSVTIDTVAPTLVAAPNGHFAYQSGQNFTYTFTGDAAAQTIVPADLAVTAVDGPNFTPSAATFDAATGTATFSFTTLLPDDNFTLTLKPGVVTDVAGNPVASDVSSTFILAGDANRDRTVNFDDLVVLAQNYNTAGKTFSQGNFDYSAGGVVNFDDLVILAQRYNTTLDAPVPQIRAASFLATPTLTLGAKNKPLKPAQDVLA